MYIEFRTTPKASEQYNYSMKDYMLTVLDEVIRFSTNKH